MEAQEIVQKLKASSYKFTLAGKIRDEIKKLNDDESDQIILHLRREIANPENVDVLTALREIIR